ncbi:MAG TPA: sugar kinase [Thermoflexia bacterium]|nr:sugar kinase [Thermoflexia bacterium]
MQRKYQRSLGSPGNYFNAQSGNSWLGTRQLPHGELDVLTIGEVVIDLISTEETSSLHDARTFRLYQGGSPANIACYVTKLGGRAALISKAGADVWGDFLVEELRQAGVLTDYLVLDPTTQTTVIFISRTSGTADSLALRNADYQLTPEEISVAAIRRARVVHASTFALSREPARSAVERAFQLARANGKFISLDPNYNPTVWPEREEALAVLRRLFPYVTFTKPSWDDAQRLFGPGKTAEEYVVRYHELGAEVVVFTQGERGMLLSYHGEQWALPAHPVEVVDATGAGDAFWAGFLLAVLDGNTLQRAMLFARQVVERTLRVVGPLREPLDRELLYAELER